MTKAKKIIAVYEIKNTVSGSFYIGSSTNLYERWRTHRKKLRSNRHPNPVLQSSWNKHGEEAFVFMKIAAFDSVEDMEAAEEGLLDASIDHPKSCNLSRWAKTPWRNAGSRHPNYGRVLSEEEKDVLRKATLEQWKTSDPRTGKKHSEETKAKISTKVREAVAEGRGGCFIPTKETRKKMSDSLRGNQSAKGHKRTEAEKEAIAQRMRGNTNWLGKTHSEASKAKMGQAVRVIDPEGNETVYPRTTAVKEQLGVFLPTIQRSVRTGKPLAKGPYKGWRFEYV